MTITANWSYPTNVRFGAGRISELAEACTEAGITSPLLVTDRGLAGLPITEKALSIMEAAGLAGQFLPRSTPIPMISILPQG